MTATYVPFEFNFSTKAATHELDDGSLVIEGMAANWEWDRESERFSPTAFAKSLRGFLRGSAPLCYSHRKDEVVGRVLDAQLRPNGVWVRAVVDPQPVSSPLRYIWEGVKRGRIASLSWGGFFKREPSAKGPVIVDTELLELSIAPISVGRGTTFKVIAEKALHAPAGKAITAHGEYVESPGASELLATRAQLERLEADVLHLRAQRLHRELGRLR